MIEKGQLELVLEKSLKADRTDHYHYPMSEQLHFSYQDPNDELAVDAVMKKIKPPYNTCPTLLEHVFAYLDRFGFINFGIYKKIHLMRPKKGLVIVNGAGISGLTAVQPPSTFWTGGLCPWEASPEHGNGMAIYGFAVVGVQEHVPTFEIENVLKFPWSVHISRQTPALTVVCFFEYWKIFNVTLNEGYAGYDMTKHEVDDYFSLIQTDQTGLLASLLKKSVKDWGTYRYILEITATSKKLSLQSHN